MGYESMNQKHGAWLSVSYNDPESRLYIYRAQPWDAIIICKPKEGGNDLFWMLKGEMWKKLSSILLKPFGAGSKRKPGKFSAGKDDYYECELAPEAEPEKPLPTHEV